MMSRHNIRSFPRSMAGVSITELMIAIVIGMLVLAALGSLFANASGARAEMERSARQIENGRFAMEILSDDLRMASFYGELNIGQLSLPGAMPDPCTTDPAQWITAMPIGLQGYDNGVGAPLCVPTNRRPGTDILVVRRTANCEVGFGDCDPLVGGKPYIQVSRCSSTSPPENVATPFFLGRQGEVNFTLRNKNCATAAPVRRYFVRIYFVANDNGRGEPIPTLMRMDLDGLTWTQSPMVEGIEELNIEYGIDWAPAAGAPPGSRNDGAPDGYTADPTTYAAAGCTTCANPVNNWSNVVTARIYLLARNIEASPNFADSKRYFLGHLQDGSEYVVSPGGPYRRHAYQGLVHLVNVGQRREIPN